MRDSAAPCLRIRPEPTTSVEAFECIEPGTQVSLLEARPYWRRIEFGGDQPGWAAKKFLEPLTTPPIDPSTGTCTIEDPWLHVHFVDVGQGDAIWIHTPDDLIDGNGRCEGFNIVIDGGPRSADYENELFAYLQPWAHHGAVVNALFVTHPHDDHYPGAKTISRHFDVRDYYDPDSPSTSEHYMAFRNAVSECADNIHLGLANFGSLNWGAELEAEVLYSYLGPSGLASGNSDPNNASIVLKITYGSHSFLFVGDAEGMIRTGSPDCARFAEKHLLDNIDHSKLKSTVLKTGHHGSETPSKNPFIRAVDPEIVFVQSGRKVYSGRTIPDASTPRRFCCHHSGIRKYRTDQNDEADGLSEEEAADHDHIVIRTNGSVLEISALEGGDSFSVDQCSPSCPQ